MIFTFTKALAQFSPADFGGLPLSEDTTQTPTQIAVNIINTLLELAGIVAVLLLVYYGIMFITSGGEEAKAEQAKKGIIWTVAGIVVISLSLYLIAAVKNAASGIV